MNTSRPRFTPRSPRRAVLVTAILSAALMFSGCTSVQTVPPSAFASLSSTVRVGDRVDCALYDGSHQRFKITDVAPDALIGGPTRIAAADIAGLTITRFDAVKTTEVTVGVIAGLGLMAYAVGDAVHHISFNYPSK